MLSLSQLLELPQAIPENKVVNEIIDLSEIIETGFYGMKSEKVDPNVDQRQVRIFKYGNLTRGHILQTKLLTSH